MMEYTLTLTQQQLEVINRLLTTTPMPWTVSHPLIEAIGVQIGQQEQQRQIAALAPQKKPRKPRERNPYDGQANGMAATNASAEATQ